ncbi:helix-turn-helix transcriptional regulator [Acrocarpospora macrocephala]|uniref:Transcriptional regulator n=1 Tax=Acrocarpospora macrocephala TaxID=150177 RepID=A0A5M3WSN0_9ACTN|nr:helix-turn-helix transcriptional regulator [Acrocarpospora macrocephala]GES10321.1 transcriptional regulator [Acrocarpospora macrocephala]
MENDLGPRLTPAQRFGRELSRVRREAGLTQARLGKRLECSSSLVAHIEIGDRNPKPDFAARCDQIFGTGNLFGQLCRNITSPTGPEWYVRWAEQIEPGARVLRSWNPLLVPGLFQTEAYARAVFQGALATSEQEVEDGVSARLRRQLILEREKPPSVWALMDEGVLRRLIGSPEVMYEQLDRLTSLATRQNILIQILAPEAPCTAGWASAFSIAESVNAPTVASVESAGRGEVSAEHEFVSMMWNRYDRIRADVCPSTQSLGMIKEARDQWKQRM